ncbi:MULTISPECIES: helix-turn-helix domain-containing protein [Niastella]|uniref:AraC family transcriptional regulator n=1 Tax=Niastella soli TaxID=2821487 RepID=A0ABS3Z582_9BACT|nr:helix-turn-helix domain-containing protein [Niastella soli]MBO9204551.1 AraC family transcriptional regulator [Niastella soli]
MDYRIILPPKNLQPFVRYFWVLENNGVADSTVTFSPLADGCPGIMYQQPDKGTFHLSENNQQLSSIFLYGQTIQPAKMVLTGKVSTVGICLQPHALQSVFGIDAHELTGTCVDLGLVQHKKEKVLQEKLLAAASIEEQINLISASLLKAAEQHSQKQDALTSFAISAITRGKGAVSFAELQKHLQLSERTLERRFKQSIGISAKLFSRICRFQESLTQLRRNNYDKLSDIAYENGYADQSHFIRSFKEFTGVSPFDYKKELKEVAENFPVHKKE